MRWIITFLLASVVCVMAQPQLGPFTLYNVMDGHAIRSPKIASYQDTLSTVYWVDEGIESSTAYYAIVNRNGALSNIIEIAHCNSPNKLVIEAANTTLAAISLRHDSSFDLFVVKIDINEPLDSTLVVAETAGFEEGFGVLPNYPEEASVTTNGWIGWTVTWATARLSPGTHEWRSTAYLGHQSEYIGFVRLQYGDTLPTEVFTVPRSFWEGGDTLSVGATSLNGNSYAYSIYLFQNGEYLYDPYEICDHEILGLMRHSHSLRYIDVDPNQPGLYRILGYTANGPCSVITESAFPRNFDILAPRWGWGYAGLTIGPDVLWIESADEVGAFTPRSNPLHRAVPGAEHREADMTLTLFGYIETLWTESVNNQDDATELKWSAVFFHDMLTSLSDSPVAHDFALSTYPNPFNSTVRIDYELPRASDVRVSIYNTLGEEVETLFDGHTNAGTHTLSWSPNSATGVYFVKLASGEYVTSRKILYLR